MSYILEAIRRSEQQRQSSAAPSLAAVPTLTDVAHEPAFLLYGIACAALVGAGIMIWWLRPWQQDGPADATAPILQTLAESRPRQDAPLPTAPLEHANPAPAQPAGHLHPQAVEELHLMEVKPYSATAHKKPKPKRQAPPTPERESMATPERAKPGNEAASSPAPNAPALPAAATSGMIVSPVPGDGKVVAMHELPPAILHEIPQLWISGYSYSTTPQERMVGINDRLVQEGQYIADGLRLEQITPDGLIFSYKSYRFRKSLP